jgi:pimeloyl-ACP methyl ester carboxylesterase
MATPRSWVALSSSGVLDALEQTLSYSTSLGLLIQTNRLGHPYSFAQLVDVAVVVNALRFAEVAPVGYDTGGPAAINYAIRNRKQVPGLVPFNCYYVDSNVRSFSWL